MILLHFRRDLKSSGSIYEGVPENAADPKRSRYCECPSPSDDRPVSQRCGYSLDVEMCDKYEGKYYSQKVLLYFCFLFTLL